MGMDLELVALDRWPTQIVRRVEELLSSCLQVGPRPAIVLCHADEHDHPSLTVETRLPA